MIVVSLPALEPETKQAHFRSTFYIRKGNYNKQETALLLEKFPKLVALLKLWWEITTKKKGLGAG